MIRPFVALAVCAAACVTTSATTASQPAQVPPARPSADATRRAMETFLAPERSGPLAAQRVALPDGSLQLDALGTGVPRITPGEHSVRVEVQIGGRSPMECMIYPTEMNVATQLRRVYTGLSSEGMQIEFHAIDAGFVGDVGFLDAQILYVETQRDGTRGVGFLKLRGANLGDRGVLCLHDEPGFRRTFDEATRAILQRPPQSPRPDRYLVRLDERVLGFSIFETSEAPERRSLSVASMLLQRSPTELVADDSVDSETWAEDGAVLHHLHVSIQNGELSRQEARRDGTTSRYAVTGRHLGRDLQGSIEGTTLFGSLPNLREAFRALQAPSAPPHFERAIYVGQNPLAATNERYTLMRRVDDTHAWFRVNVGPLEVQMLGRPDGHYDEIVMSLTGHMLTFRQVSDAP